MKSMSEDKSKKPDTKMIIVFVVACLALVGGILASIFIKPEPIAQTDDTQEVSTTKTEESEEDKTKSDYDATKLLEQTQEIEDLYTKFSAYIEYKYSTNSTKLDFTNDPEAQAMLSQFITLSDALGETIKQSPYDNFKETWKEYETAFNLRRDEIIYGIDEDKDTEWAWSLMIICSQIKSELDVTSGGESDE